MHGIKLSDRLREAILGMTLLDPAARWTAERSYEKLLDITFDH